MAGTLMFIRIILMAVLLTPLACCGDTPPSNADATKAIQKYFDTNLWANGTAGSICRKQYSKTLLGDLVRIIGITRIEKPYNKVKQCCSDSYNTAWPIEAELLLKCWFDNEPHVFQSKGQFELIDYGESIGWSVSETFWSEARP